MLTDSQLSMLDNRIQNMKNEIATNKEKINQIEALQIRKESLEVLRQNILAEEAKFKEAVRFCVKYQNDKRESDFESIREAMKAASLIIQTPSEPQVELYSPPNRLRPETLLMVVKDGKRFPVELREGTGIAEGFSSMTILSALQATSFAKVAIMDEMYSSVSPENTLNISENLNDLIDGKFQLILIEQKNEIVLHTDYREFIIDNDGLSSSVSYIDHYNKTNRDGALIDGGDVAIEGSD